jgi:hypothetical protein
MKFLFRSLFFVIFGAAGFFASVFTSSLPDDSQAHVPANNLSEEQSVATKTTQDQFSTYLTGFFDVNGIETLNNCIFEL